MEKQENSAQKFSNIVHSLLELGILIFSGILVWQGIQVVHTTIVLKNEISEIKEERKELDGKQKKLQSEKNNLANPDYVEIIARGKYLVAQEGEQIFKFPDLDLENRK